MGIVALLLCGPQVNVKKKVQNPGSWDDGTRKGNTAIHPCQHLVNQTCGLEYECPKKKVLKYVILKPGKKRKIGHNPLSSHGARPRPVHCFSSYVL